MSADASSSFVSLRRRSLFVAMFALAACESDPTPVVHENANGDGNMNLAPTSGGRGGPGIGGKDPDYRLGANGVLAFPLIGSVNAQGQTTGQLQQAIASRLDPDFLRNPSVSAEVITRRPFYVIGEVQKPGNYPYVTDMTALQAIAMAGGYTYRARQNNLFLKRLDTNGRMVRVAATPETKIRPGDTVEIKERYF